MSCKEIGRMLWAWAPASIFYIAKQKAIYRFLFVLIFGLILFLLAWHFGEMQTLSNVVSPDGAEEEIWKYNWPKIIISAICVIGASLFLWFSFLEIRRHFGSPTCEGYHNDEESYPEKLRVHVVLPTNKNNYKNTLGDGLIQAAGFLAASDAYNDRIEIIPHDHENNPDKAWDILEGIINEEKDKNEPICVVFTMSSIASNVFKKCSEKITKYPEVEKRLSVLFTVCSNPPQKLHEHTNFFCHFVDGKDETKEIVRFCTGQAVPKCRERKYVPKALLIVMGSSYPQKTAGDIEKQLKHIKIKDKKFQITSIHLDTKDQIADSGMHLIERFIEETEESERFAIIVAYDKALLESITALKKKNYKGFVIGTTTLSVKDWQEYLERTNNLSGNDMKVLCTSTVGFDPHDTKSLFSQRLNRWTFDRVIEQNVAPRKFYRTDPDIDAWFEDIEKEVYKNIDSNYISAFCFDSVRLFKIMHKHEKWRLDGILDCDHTEQHEESPFANNELFKHAKTIVPITITPL